MKVLFELNTSRGIPVTSYCDFVLKNARPGADVIVLHQAQKKTNIATRGIFENIKSRKKKSRYSSEENLPGITPIKYCFEQTNPRLFRNIFGKLFEQG